MSCRRFWLRVVLVANGCAVELPSVRETVCDRLLLKWQAFPLWKVEKRDYREPSTAEQHQHWLSLQNKDATLSLSPYSLSAHKVYTETTHTSLHLITFLKASLGYLLHTWSLIKRHSGLVFHINTELFFFWAYMIHYSFNNMWHNIHSYILS